MGKTYLGIDIGHRNLKLSLVSDGKIKKTCRADVPDNLVKEGRVVSYVSMAEFIKNTMKENGIQAAPAAFVLNSEDAYIRNISVPAMTHDQLMVNIPYEFRDYISDELQAYAYDYAVLDTYENEEGAVVMDLLAAAAPKEYLNDIKNMLKKAGMKFAVAAPSAAAYIGFLKSHGLKDPEKEYCFLDLGHEAIRMHVFKGERYIVTRALETGLSVVEQRIADELNVDIHLAHSYFISDYEGCQKSEACISAYQSIGTELERAVNFYRFSNPDSVLEHIYICGGGAAVEPLMEEIANSLSIGVSGVSELFGGDRADDYLFVQSSGITYQE